MTMSINKHVWVKDVNMSASREIHKSDFMFIESILKYIKE